MRTLPSRQQILDYLFSFSFQGQGERSPEDKSYITTHVDRMLRTMQLLAALPPGARALDLGAGAFHLALLLRKYLDLDLAATDVRADYGQPCVGEGQDTLSSARYGETYTFRYQLVNIERDPFPYADGTFDLVLCCEVLEHLIADPSHMLRETHRVLRPGGQLMITTPNQVQFDHIVCLVRGWNVAYPYSGYGVYHRHNREYTPREVDQLLRMHNFTPQFVIVEDLFRNHSLSHRLLTKVGPLRWRRDTILALSRAHGQPVQLYPEWLYSQNSGRRRVTRNWIVMGDADIYQLGPGWHECESWAGEGSRWTTRQAVAYLRPQGQETSLRLCVSSGPGGARGEVRVQGLLAGSYSVATPDLQELDFPLPEGVRASIAAGAPPEVEVQIDVANPFVPGPQDTRELGVAVRRMWLE